MIGVLLTIGLFVWLILIVDRAQESETSCQWPRPWDKSI